jgi:hypothetical protein
MSAATRKRKAPEPKPENAKKAGKKAAASVKRAKDADYELLDGDAEFTLNIERCNS